MESPKIKSEMIKITGKGKTKKGTLKMIAEETKTAIQFFFSRNKRNNNEIKNIKSTDIKITPMRDDKSPVNAAMLFQNKIETIKITKFKTKRNIFFFDSISV